MKIKVPKIKAEEALDKLREEGSVSFDGQNGNFAVSGVEGRFSYEEETETLTVVIDDKPWLVSEEYVYGEIKKYFN